MMKRRDIQIAGQTLYQLMNIAKEEKVPIAIVAGGGAFEDYAHFFHDLEGRHDEVIILAFEQLSLEDQARINAAGIEPPIMQDDFLKSEILKLTAQRIDFEPLPERLLSSENKMWYERFPKKKSKKSYRK